jgi:hypothetical protein
MNKAELKSFIAYKSVGTEVEDRSLRIRIDEAEWWSGELGALAYLFSHVLENLGKQDGYNCGELITLLYALTDSMNFTLHECDVAFVKFMLRNLRDREIELTDELVELQSHLVRHEYGTLRIGH